MYDIIVVGAGPAGLTAAIYAKRAGKSVLVIEKGTFGGQITFSPRVENIPGFSSVTGNEFAEKLVEQALNLGTDMECAEVLEIKDGETKIVITDSGSFEGRTVIIAAGAEHRRLDIADEEKYLGNGISFCAVCDGAFYEGRDVAVVGGGNSALQEAILLSEACRKVYVVQNLPFVTGEKALYDLLCKKENVEFIFNARIEGYLGESSLAGLTVSINSEKRVIDVDGVFVAIGLEPKIEMFSQVVELDENGYAASAEDCKTKTDGIFVAGDCRRKDARQVVTAAADGAVSALAACSYLDKKNNL